MATALRKPTREEMLNSVVRFRDLYASDEAPPDVYSHEHRRSLLDALGFQGENVGDSHPADGPGSQPDVIHLRPSFGLAFAQVRVGGMVMMRAHETNETVLLIDGKWQLCWEGRHGVESVDVEALDIISFPAGVRCRFRCVSAAAGKDKGTLFAIQDNGLASPDESLSAVPAPAMVAPPQDPPVNDQHESLPLTPRQFEVLALLIQGKPNKLISRALNLKEGTIRTHISAIYRALKVTNRTQAVYKVTRLGIQVAPGPRQPTESPTHTVLRPQSQWTRTPSGAHAIHL